MECCGSQVPWLIVDRLFMVVNVSDCVIFCKGSSSNRVTLGPLRFSIHIDKTHHSMQVNWSQDTLSVIRPRATFR